MKKVKTFPSFIVIINFVSNLDYIGSEVTACQSLLEQISQRFLGMKVQGAVLLLTKLIPSFVWATRILDLSLDVDHAPDSNGSYTHAALEKMDLPQSFTICSAYMVEAWTTAYSAARMWMLKDDDGIEWGTVILYAATDYTEYGFYLGPTNLIAPGHSPWTPTPPSPGWWWMARCWGRRSTRWRRTRPDLPTFL